MVVAVVVVVVTVVVVVVVDVVVVAVVLVNVVVVVLQASQVIGQMRRTVERIFFFASVSLGMKQNSCTSAHCELSG